MAAGKKEACSAVHIESGFINAETADLETPRTQYLIKEGTEGKFESLNDVPRPLKTIFNFKCK